MHTPAWTIHTNGSNLQFEAASDPGSCLAANPVVWPVPTSRNYLLQLVPCLKDGSDPMQLWQAGARAGDAGDAGNRRVVPRRRSAGRGRQVAAVL